MIKNKIKNILISQPAPADLDKSQYKILLDKYDVNLTFNKFFNVVKISNKEFRALRINILDYTAVIFTSKLAIDNYFIFVKELRLVVPDSMKFFCITDSVANYLQNYIQYRKRKIFYGKLIFDELLEVIAKHKEERFLFPCAEDSTLDNFKKLDKLGINYDSCVMYRSEPKDLSDMDISKFDMVVLFSPIGVKAFTQSFPNINSDNLCFAAFGKVTINALNKSKIKVVVPAPTVKSPSMVMALDSYLESLSKDDKSEKVTKTTKKTVTSSKKTTSKTAKVKTTSSKTKTITKKTVKE
ncbi:MAG: uroporphyrinogen-III synthase [Bacteroidales bacterium]|jgi:uroporphyrinogen-III synthase|nr:uroporphyrinogen-III synthase [Bacteroidales bacterium]